MPELASELVMKGWTVKRGKWLLQNFKGRSETTSKELFKKNQEQNHTLLDKKICHDYWIL